MVDLNITQAFELVKYLDKSSHPTVEIAVLKQLQTYQQVIDDAKEFRKKLEIQMEIQNVKEKYYQSIDSLLTDNHNLRKDVATLQQKLFILTNEIRTLRPYKYMQQNQQTIINNLSKQIEQYKHIKQLLNSTKSHHQQQYDMDDVLKEQKSRLQLLIKSVQLKQKELELQQQIINERRMTIEFNLNVQSQMLKSIHKEIERTERQTDYSVKSSLHSEVDHEKQQLLIENYEAEILRMQQLIQEFKIKIAVMAKQKVFTEEEYQRNLKSINDEYNGYKLTSEKEMHNLKQSTQGFKKNVQKVQQQLRQLTEQNAKQKQELIAKKNWLEHKIQQIQSTYQNRLLENENRLNLRIKEYEQGKNRLQEKVRQLTENNKNSKAEIKLLKRELEQKQFKNNTNNRERELEGKFAELKSQLENLSLRLKETEAKYNQDAKRSNQVIERLTEDEGFLKIVVKDLKQDKRQLEQEIVQLKRNHSKEVKQLQDRNRIATSTLNHYQQSKTGQIVDLRKRLQTTLEDFSRLSIQNRNLQDQIQILNRETRQRKLIFEQEKEMLKKEIYALNSLTRQQKSNEVEEQEYKQTLNSLNKAILSLLIL